MIIGDLPEILLSKSDAMEAEAKARLIDALNLIPGSPEGYVGTTKINEIVDCIIEAAALKALIGLARFVRMTTDGESWETVDESGNRICHSIRNGGYYQDNIRGG